VLANGDKKLHLVLHPAWGKLGLPLAGAPTLTGAHGYEVGKYLDLRPGTESVLKRRRFPGPYACR
jgi:hypothetical protein